MSYLEMGTSELLREKIKVENQYNGYFAENLNLAMSRGIPNHKMIEITARKFKID